MRPQDDCIGMSLIASWGIWSIPHMRKQVGRYLKEEKEGLFKLVQVQDAPLR